MDEKTYELFEWVKKSISSIRERLERLEEQIKVYHHNQVLSDTMMHNTELNRMGEMSKLEERIEKLERDKDA